MAVAADSSCGERGFQVVGHLERRGSRGGAEFLLAVLFVALLLVSENDQPGIIDDGPPPVFAESRDRILGRRALRAVTGDQENCVWHNFTQMLGLLRIRRAD